MNELYLLPNTNGNPPHYYILTDNQLFDISYKIKYSKSGLDRDTYIKEYKNIDKLILTYQ